MLNINRVVEKAVPLFWLFCDSYRKCTAILIFFSLLKQEIYDASHLTFIL